MKLIQVVLLLVSWIVWSPSYTQTDTTYTLKISKARLLVADSYTKRVQDSLIVTQSEKITLLESEKGSMWANFNSILQNEKDKTKAADSIANDYKKLNEESESQIKYLKRKERKARRERNIVVVISLVLLTIGVTY